MLSRQPVRGGRPGGLLSLLPRRESDTRRLARAGSQPASESFAAGPGGAACAAGERAREQAAQVAAAMGTQSAARIRSRLADGGGGPAVPRL